MSFHPATNLPPVFIVIVATFVILTALIVTLIKVLIYCKLFSKAGYCWALGLLVLVPIANIVMPCILAFADWPILKQLRALKQEPARNIQ